CKDAWSNDCTNNRTQSETCWMHGNSPAEVPMTRETDKRFGYAKRDGFTAVSLTYAGDDLQFLVLLPDDVNGLHALESKLTADMLAGCANLEKRDVDLHLPKFKLQPPTITLAEKFEALGMKTAFDKPKANANFDKLAPRTPTDY